MRARHPIIPPIAGKAPSFFGTPGPAALPRKGRRRNEGTHDSKPTETFSHTQIVDLLRTNGKVFDIQVLDSSGTKAFAGEGLLDTPVAPPPRSTLGINAEDAHYNARADEAAIQDAEILATGTFDLMRCGRLQSPPRCRVR